MHKYLGLLGLHCLFSIPSPAPLGEVINCGKFNEGREDKGIADCNEPIHGSSVSHFRKRVSSTDAEGGHGEHCGHTWWRREVGHFHSLNLVLWFCFDRSSHRGSRAQIRASLTAHSLKLFHIFTCQSVSNSPKTVRAGTDSRLSQKETCDRITVMKQGM